MSKNKVVSSKYFAVLKQMTELYYAIYLMHYFSVVALQAKWPLLDHYISDATKSYNFACVHSLVDLSLLPSIVTLKVK